MDISFCGKRALVTGASQGIGKAIVLELVKKGANVIALSKTQQNLDLLKKEVPEVEIVCLDVSNWKGTEKVIKDLGDIDLLVNNAGVLSLQSVGSITEEEFDWCFSINVKSVVNISQIVATNMKNRNKGGSIVNISSQTAMIAIENHATYCASKGALDQLTKVMALELAPYQIRVNTVNPTVVLTGMGTKALGDEVAGDIVGAVIFLLSDHSSMITGAHIPIDGGYTIQ